jgi:hypothetical protein
MLYLTNQRPGKGVILPFDVWVGNDGMMVINLFLPQIQNSTLFPRIRKSRCIILPKSILGCTNSPLGSSWAFGRRVCPLRS